MQLTKLRRERDELIAEMKSENPNQGRDYENCARGNYEDFFNKYSEHDEDSGGREWESAEHEMLFNLCKEISDLERDEYYAAFKQ